MGTHAEPAEQAPATDRRLASTTAGVRDGSGGAPTVTLVHGFAQTSACFGPFGAAIEAEHPVRRVDQPGHGGSLRHREADLTEGAELLVRTVGPSVLVGYSMGARLALTAAVRHPEQVTALVLVGGTAGIDGADARAARRAEDEARAQRLEAIGLSAFLEEWLAMPMFAGLPGWARFDEERRRNTVEGLAASLRRAGTGSMTPLWDRLGELRCPLLCVTGALDQRYGQLADRLVAGVAGPARHVVVEDAGHAAHLERPEAAADAVLAFLRELAAG